MSGEDWLQTSKTGVQADGAAGFFDRIETTQAQTGGSDVFANGVEILRFGMDMDEFAMEFSENAQNGLYAPMKDGVGLLYASQLRDSMMFHFYYNEAHTALLDQLGKIAASCMAIGMAARGAAVDYLNADGGGGLDIESIYGRNSDSDQKTLFETDEDGRPVLSEDAKTEDQKQDDADARKEAEEIEEAVDDILSAEDSVERPEPGAKVPDGMVIDPITDDYILLPEGATAVYNDVIPSAGTARPSSGSDIFIGRDDEQVEVW